MQLFYDINKTSTRLASSNIVKAFHVFFVALLQHHVFGVFVTKQGDGINGCLFQVPEGNNIAKGLRRIINAVSARKRLHQAVIAQILINKQGVKRRRIKAR